MTNPFKNVKQFKAFENFEAKTGVFRTCAAELIKRMNPMREGLRLDAGCGTGNSTFPLVVSIPYGDTKRSVVGFDSDSRMVATACIKFGQSIRGHPVPQNELLRRLVMKGEIDIAKFLADFYSQLIQSRSTHNVSFVQKDAFDFTPSEPAVGCVASHLIHWMWKQAVDSGRPLDDIPKAFARMLREGAEVAFSSSANFWTPQTLSLSDFNYLENPFVRTYLEILAAKIENLTGNPVQLPEKTRQLPSVLSDLFQDNGFSLKLYDEVPVPRIPVSLVLSNHLFQVPAHLQMFRDFPTPATPRIAKLTENTKVRLIRESIAEALSTKSGLIPPDGFNSDIWPIWVFTKTAKD